MAKTRALGAVLVSVAAVTLGLATLAAQQPQEPRFSGPSSQTLHQILNDYWEWRLADEPELATSVGRRELNDRWTDWSPEAREQARRMRQEYLERAMWLTPGTLNPQDYLSALLVEHELRAALDVQSWLDLQLVSQRGGLHTRVFTTVEQMPTATLGDYENILARLRAVPAYVDQMLTVLDDQLAAGRSRPAVIVDLMLEQVVAQRMAPAFESPLLAAFARFPDTLPASAQRRLRAAAVGAYERQFVPSWERLERYLRERYRPRAREAVSMSAIPNGADGYARLVRYHTTTPMSPQEIHDVGLKEVSRIEGEMRAIMGEYGFTGSIAEFEADLAARPGMRFESEDEMLAYAEDVLASVQPRLSRLFANMPRTEVRVRSIPPDRAEGTASNYSAGTSDGSRPAYFNLNTFRPVQQLKYPAEALVLHEAVPGHHLQLGLARELAGVPSFRTVFNATSFVEGWALYAESLGAELGGVYRDPATRFGRLARERFRAVRLVVDTGIHAMGWSRDRARAYFRERAPAQSLAEVDRYIADPGQALAYKIGELRIRALRRRAETTLGPRFDVRVFHDVVLRNGALPLDLLEDEVNRYLAAATTGRAAK